MFQIDKFIHINGSLVLSLKKFKNTMFVTNLKLEIGIQRLIYCNAPFYRNS
jgi:hypothetical protein